MRSLWKSSIAALVATVSVAVASGSVAATSVPDDDGESAIVIIDEGKGDERLDLNAPMIEGTVARVVDTTRTMGTIQVSGTQNVDETIDVTTTIETAIEVAEVAPDGGYTIIRTTESYDFAINSGSTEFADSFKDDDELESLVGVAREHTFDATGQLLDITVAAGTTLTSEQQAAVDELIEEGSEREPFPDVDVGVGAVWTAEMPDTGGAIARFELQSIVGGTAVVELSFEADPAEMEDVVPDGFDEVSGTMSGGGTYTVDLDNRFDGSSELTLDLDMTLTGQGIQMTMDIDTTNTQVAIIEL